MQTTIGKRAALAVALVSAAGTFGALGSAAPVSAEPKSWDLGQYDSCMADTDIRGIENDWGSAQSAREQRKCCLNSGGVYRADGTCVAPSVQERSPNDGGQQPTQPVFQVPAAGAPPARI